MKKNLLLPLIALALFACGETSTPATQTPTEAPAPSVQTITIDKDDQTELKAAIADPSNTSSVYHAGDVAFTTDGTNWVYSKDCGLAGSNNAGYAEHNLFQLKKSSGYIANTEALAPGYTKAIVTFYTTYDSQATQYLPVVSEGLAADQLLAVSPVTDGVEVLEDGTFPGKLAGWNDGSKEARLHKFEYNLDATSTFFQVKAGAGALYLESVVLQ